MILITLFTLAILALNCMEDAAKFHGTRYRLKNVTDAYHVFKAINLLLWLILVTLCLSDAVYVYPPTEFPIMFVGAWGLFWDIFYAWLTYKEKPLRYVGMKPDLWPRAVGADDEGNAPVGNLLFVRGVSALLFFGPILNYFS